MDRNTLMLLIHQKGREFDRNRLRRAVQVILVFAAVLLFAVFIFTDYFAGRTFEDIIGIAVLCLIYSCVNFIVNAPIFWHLTNKNKAESDMLENLKQQLKEVEKNENY